MFLTDHLYFILTNCWMSLRWLNILKENLQWFLMSWLYSWPIWSSWSPFMESGTCSKVKAMLLRDDLHFTLTMLNISELVEYFDTKPSLSNLSLALLMLLEFLMSIHSIRNILKNQENAPDRWLLFHSSKLLNISDLAEYLT